MKSQTALSPAALAAIQLGAAIRSVREKRGMTLARMATLSNASIGNVSRVENGGTRRLSQELLHSIANALDVEVYELYAAAAGVTLPKDEILTDEELRLVKGYRAMSFTQREMLNKVASKFGR